VQRQPEDDQHDQHRSDAVPHRAVLHGGELFIGNGNRAGQAHPGIEFAGQIEVFGRLADGVGGGLAGFKGVEIQDRLELDEGAAVGIGQRLVADQFAPRKSCRNRY